MTISTVDALFVCGLLIVGMFCWHRGVVISRRPARRDFAELGSTQAASLAVYQEILAELRKQSEALQLLAQLAREEERRRQRAESSASISATRAARCASPPGPTEFGYWESMLGVAEPVWIELPPPAPTQPPAG